MHHSYTSAVKRITMIETHVARLIGLIEDEIKISLSEEHRRLLVTKYTRLWWERIGTLCIRDILLNNSRKKEAEVARRRLTTMSIQNGYPVVFTHLCYSELQNR